jgi:signal transduction histidine kinase
MFKKLRNKFIWTNMITATVIIVVAFTSIFFATAVSHHGPIDARRDPALSDEMNVRFEEAVKKDRADRLSNLGVTLVLVGLIIELLVFWISCYMAERAVAPVKQAYDKQREFIANASHELKTPIAAARANFEALGTTEQPWIDNVDMELDRASKLVNDLLTLARTDGRTTSLKKKEVDVAKIVEKRAQLVKARLGDKVLKINTPKACKIVLVESDLMQILDILLDNAAKYSKSFIEVTVNEKSIAVENDGKTIPSDKLKKIFDRFYQTDKTAEGSGLGLAIAKAVADQNKWKLVADSDKKTTTFTLSF